MSGDSDTIYRDVPVSVVCRYVICTCGETLRPTGTVYMSNPAYYEHLCPKCDKRVMLTEKSGTVHYIPVKL